MEIIWFGHACFRIRAREATIITDPYDRRVGLSLPRQTADIVTVSHYHPGHGNVDAVPGARVVDGPGEYEIQGVFITGIRTFHDNEGGKRLGRNTVFVIEAEELTLCHLGDLGHVLTPDQVEALPKVDILLIPVGNHSTIGPAEAAEVISLLEPSIIIPMHYRIPGLKTTLEPVDRFLHEVGQEAVQPRPRLNVTRRDLTEEPQVVLLEPRGAERP